LLPDRHDDWAGLMRAANRGDAERWLKSLR
jgi:hypothetical protein